MALTAFPDLVQDLSWCWMENGEKYEELTANKFQELQRVFTEKQQERVALLNSVFIKLPTDVVLVIAEYHANVWKGQDVRIAFKDDEGRCCTFKQQVSAL